MRSDGWHPVARLPEQWRRELSARGEPGYRADQLFQWIHQRGVCDPAAMTNLPQALRAALGRDGLGAPVTVEACHRSADGARKLLCRLGDGGLVETVLLPATAPGAAEDADQGAVDDAADGEPSTGADGRAGGAIRVTQCVSTQVGCAMGCRICASGAAGLRRHLGAEEIAGQWLAALPRLEPREALRNVLFMGMGEPLHNYDATAQAIRLLTHRLGLGFSPRRITVSTCGLADGIDRLGRDFGGAVGLAVSLHGADDRTRAALCPAGRRHRLAELMAALGRYPLGPRQRLTIEYTLVADRNDGPAQARALAALLGGLRVRVNLIPLNPIAGSELRPSPPARVAAFQQQLQRAGLLCFVRRRRGDDVAAACGQLALRAAGPLTNERADRMGLDAEEQAMPTDEILDQARAWVQHDPDPETRAELEALIEARAPELAERFAGPLAFGTAGLRGVLGAGETRMNRAVVRRTSAGLAHYLLERVADSRARGVVVGYDGRRMSRELAADTAAVLCAAGLPVKLAADLCPTPIVAFAVRHLGAAAGVMITASHNPPAYNGYKVYAANGAQIIPPIDRWIADAITASPLPAAIACADLEEAERSGQLVRFGAELDQRYLDAIAELAPRTGGDRSLCIAYTPLHGVGNRLLRRALAAAGFANVHSVAEQAEPDGAFPTVSFPNPEEPGALDRAVALAEQVGADLILANDPDADRLAVAVRQPAGGYRQLSGNEVGALLGHHALTTAAGPAADRLVVTTVVSSPWLGAIAQGVGARYAETLTGFKWIANRAMALEASDGARFLFGYEEALGYTVGTVVRDKDGISAALVMAVLAAELRAAGRTLLDRLDELAVAFGLYASAQRSVVLAGRDGQQRMQAAMAALRDGPPAELGGRPVVAVVDCWRGVRRPAGGADQPLDLPQSNVLIFELEGGARVVARPSGTEPKIKLYVDVREQPARADEVAAARQRAAAQIAALVQELLQASGLATPDEP